MLLSILVLQRRVKVMVLMPLSTIFQLYRGGENHRPVASP
jgi:hypothetical protein